MLPSEPFLLLSRVVLTLTELQSPYSQFMWLSMPIISSRVVLIKLKAIGLILDNVQQQNTKEFPSKLWLSFFDITQCCNHSS